VYLVGGFVAPSNTVYDHALRYNLLSPQWSESAASLQVPRYGGQAVNFGGEIAYLGSGRYVEAYSPTTGAFRTLPKMMASRTGHAAVVLSGRIYAIGGSGPLDSVEVYTPPPETNIFSSVLPASRSVQVSGAATAFATILNAGSATAKSCGLSPLTSVPATFSYQTTDRATNRLTGTPNTPATIAAGGAQTYVLAFTPTAAFAPTDVMLSFNCINTSDAPVYVGLNTLLLAATTGAGPDVVALAATITNDGVANIPGVSGTGFFSVATANVGAAASITASADTGGKTLPITLSICQTNPSTGACLSTPAASVTSTHGAGATSTFAVFVAGSGPVPFDPVGNRAYVRFKDSGGATRGATSVAVRTQ
jgi:hypothetical protein